MSLNFPTTPSDQEVYENYIYDATKGVWNKVITGIGTADDNAIFKATLFFGGNS